MTGANTEVFQKDIQIRFAHCDPAGIVYFPNYLVLTNALVEDWFNERLGIDFAHYIGERRLGLPIVKLECEFLLPSRHGEILTFSLRVTKIGRRSIGLSIFGSANGQTRLRSDQVLVATSLDTGGSIELPQDLRRSLELFCGVGNDLAEAVK